MNLFVYIVVAVLLIILELVYFRLAEHYRIIDKPNERSSHAHPTIRGGGIIFILAAFLFTAFNEGAYPFLMIALLLSGLVSFIDDIRSMPNWLRFLTHLVSSLLVLYQADLGMLQPMFIVLIVILSIGVLNAYNFMDGINGMTGLYSLAVILPIWFSESNHLLKELQGFSLIGIAVFLFFNARKNARCFAGDVGSVTIAVMVLFLLLSRIKQTGDLNYIAFLMLYGIDTVVTIAQRLYLKENIFRAHRKHLFQLFSNELGRPHLLVSMVYAVVQLVLNVIVVYADLPFYFLITSILSFGLFYIVIKVSIYKRLLSSERGR